MDRRVRRNFHHLMECAECAEPRECALLSSPLEMSRTDGRTVTGAVRGVYRSGVPRRVKRVPLVRCSKRARIQRSKQARFKHIPLTTMSAFFIRGTNRRRPLLFGHADDTWYSSPANNAPEGAIVRVLRMITYLPRIHWKGDCDS